MVAVAFPSSARTGPVLRSPDFGKVQIVITETARRHLLFTEAKRSLGEPAAEVLMDLLPPNADEIATKTDLRVLSTELRGEFRTEMAGLRGELRTEMAEMRTELRTEMAELRTEFRTEMAGMRADVSTQISQAIAQQTRTMVFAVIGAVLSVVPIALAASHLA
jgi:hypothetical protein